MAIKQGGSHICIVKTLKGINATQFKSNVFNSKEFNGEVAINHSSPPGKQIVDGC